MDPRAIWLITHNGTPLDWKWALVARPSEVDLAALPANVRAAKVPDDQKRGWAAALSPEQEADPAYDATPSLWRRVPLVAQLGVLGPDARLVGRDLVANGVKLRLDDRGRPHPASRPDEPCEPLEPDGEVVDEAALLDCAKRIGAPVEVVERVKPDVVRAEPDKPAVTRRPKG